MSDTWTREDLRKVKSFGARDYYEWLREGLMLWDNPQMVWRAFAPIQDRFTLRDDPEPQLAELFEVMSLAEQATFLEALALGFTEAESNNDGYDFFDSLCRITTLLKRPEPIPTLIARLRDSPFLDAASEDVASHLYAYAFLVIEAAPAFSDVALVRHLMTSLYWDPAYEPKVQEILARFEQTTASS